MARARVSVGEGARLGARWGGALYTCVYLHLPGPRVRLQRPEANLRGGGGGGGERVHLEAARGEAKGSRAGARPVSSRLPPPLPLPLPLSLPPARWSGGASACTGKRPPHALGTRSMPAGQVGWKTPMSCRVRTLKRKRRELRTGAVALALFDWRAVPADASEARRRWRGGHRAWRACAVRRAPCAVRVRGRGAGRRARVCDFGQQGDLSLWQPEQASREALLRRGGGRGT